MTGVQSEPAAPEDEAVGVGAEAVVWSIGGESGGDAEAPGEKSGSVEAVIRMRIVRKRFIVCPFPQSLESARGFAITDYTQNLWQSKGELPGNADESGKFAGLGKQLSERAGRANEATHLHLADSLTDTQISLEWPARNSCTPEN